MVMMVNVIKRLITIGSFRLEDSILNGHTRGARVSVDMLPMRSAQKSTDGHSRKKSNRFYDYLVAQV